MRFLIALTLCVAAVLSAPLEEDGLYRPESLGPDQDGSYREISSERPASEDDGLYHPETQKPEENGSYLEVSSEKPASEDDGLYHPELLRPEEDGAYREVSSERPIGEDDGQYHAEPIDSINIEAQSKLIDLNAPHSSFIDPFNNVKVDIPLTQPNSAVYTFYSGRSSPYEYVPIQVKTEGHDIPVAPVVQTRIVPGTVASVLPRILESPVVPIVQQPVLDQQVVPIVSPRILDGSTPVVQQRVIPTGAVIPGVLPIQDGVNFIVLK